MLQHEGGRGAEGGGGGAGEVIPFIVACRGCRWGEEGGEVARCAGLWQVVPVERGVAGPGAGGVEVGGGGGSGTRCRPVREVS